MRKNNFEIGDVDICNTSFFSEQTLFQKMRLDPSLNTQSSIKGLLVVRNFCFWAIWAVGPVHEKKVQGGKKLQNS